MAVELKGKTIGLLREAGRLYAATELHAGGCRCHECQKFEAIMQELNRREARGKHWREKDV